MIRSAATCLQWWPVFWKAGQLHWDEMPSPPSWIVVRYGSLSDPLIRAVASELAACLRPYDQAFRYGGEEFVILLGQTGLDKGMEIAERIRRRIAARCRPEADPGRRITVSLGLAEFDAAETPAHMFDRADKALYRAKQEGRNRSVAWTH